MQGNDAAVYEGHKVIPIKVLSIYSVHFLGADEVVSSIEKPLKSDVFGVSDVLVLESAATVLNDGFVIELTGNWVNKSNESVAVLSLHFHLNVSDMISGCACYVSGFNLRIRNALEQNDQ